MATQSKENNVLKLILETSPLKEWHFEEIVKEAKVTKTVANKWIKKYLQSNLLKKIKKKGKFPYVTVGENNPVYYAQKRIYALQQLHDSGLFSKLFTMPAKTIILFGSFAKGDWYKNSDIDVFVFGNLANFNKKVYEGKLQRHIELHSFETREEIQEVRTGLIKNVINGYVIKGEIQDIIELA